MAKENLKYKDQTITVNGKTERYSTNGHYTGLRMGTPTQDTKLTENDAYFAEHNTIRYNQITQDKIAGSVPDIDSGTPTEGG